MTQFQADVTRLTNCDSGWRDPSKCQLIAIHTYECPRGDDLESRADWQQTSQTGSYTILVGTERTLRANDDNYIPWSAGATGNARGLHLSFLAYSASSRDEWLRYDKQLRLGARVAADWCTRYGIPARKLTSSEVKAGTRGICGHGEISAAWREVDHTDPGANFPWDVFIAYVKEYMGGAPAPTTSSSSEGSSLMTLTEKFFTDWMSGYLGPQINALQQVWQQLRGPGGRGWPQLGQDAQGRDLTPVDALAAIRVQLADLAREQQEIKALLKGAK
ncbi:peptidoglycan recognition protein family protein [Corynebacterium vitaeruminis]|uniref:peptidoglycan recognition protein family protein n=1 Tax=Corynebacterium vitaeruminis TaxID=38305 RepID=UPI0023F38FE7|nr:N-acetylmuramoyl-L-alanine amidase [Corynebacterium vitaeruminis]